MTTHTLLLRCAAPLQSWGSRSRFTERDTEREPTKSGVIGLLCAALGRAREEPVEDLATLRMGVRVDLEGVVQRDYQTALEVRKADPKARPDTLVSNRYYLSDAVFLVGFEGKDLGQVRLLHRALENPTWPLFMGRKAFVPSEPVWLEDGLREGVGLEEALRHYPSLVEPWRSDGSPWRIVLECLEGEEGEVRMDVPVSFVSTRRLFATRRVRIDYITRPATHPDREVTSCS